MVEKGSIVRRNSTIRQAYFFLSKLPYSSSELLSHIIHPPVSCWNRVAPEGIDFRLCEACSYKIRFRPIYQMADLRCLGDQTFAGPVYLAGQFISSSYAPYPNACLELATCIRMVLSLYSYLRFVMIRRSINRLFNSTMSPCHLEYPRGKGLGTSRREVRKRRHAKNNNRRTKVGRG
jgi:hypothetical protein